MRNTSKYQIQSLRFLLTFHSLSLHVYPSLVSSLDSRFQQVTGRAAWSLGRAMRPRLQILERHVAILGFGDGTTVVTVQTFHGIPGTFRASAASDTFEAEGMILQPKSQDPVVRVMDAINEGSALSWGSLNRSGYSIKSGYNWWALPDTTLGELQLLNHDLIP